MFKAGQTHEELMGRQVTGRWELVLLNLPTISISKAQTFNMCYQAQGRFGEGPVISRAAFRSVQLMQPPQCQ